MNQNQAQNPADESEDEEPTIVKAIQDLAKFIESKRFWQLSAQNQQRHRVVLSFLYQQYSQKGSPEARGRWDLAKVTARGANRGQWVARQILKWEQHWVSNREIPEGKQGCNSNVTSLLNDEGLLVFVRGWINSHKNSISTRDLAVAVSEYTESNKAGRVIEDVMGEAENEPAPDNGKPFAIRIRTARNWLRRLGLEFQQIQKGVYRDGHERPDVVSYRQEIFVPRFLELLKLSVQVNDEGNAIYPKNIDQPLVFVTHDESHFCTNDGTRAGWFKEGHQPIRPKGNGRGIMVSDFLTPMGRLPNTAQLLETGKDNWWTSEMLVQQLENAVAAFKTHFPGCKGVWLFDNATSHSAFSKDALVANSVSLNPGGKQPRMKDGYFFKDGRKVVQPMCFPEDHPAFPGQPKGARVILQERGLWDSSLPLTCRKDKGNCNGKCCARSIIADQIDFKNQHSMLEELLESQGQIVLFYPKFHCELNWIERYWGACKAFTRQNCTYTFPGLRNTVPLALAQVPNKTISRYFNKTVRIVEAYAQNLEYETSQFQSHVNSHRRIYDHSMF